LDKPLTYFRPDKDPNSLLGQVIVTKTEDKISIKNVYEVRIPTTNKMFSNVEYNKELTVKKKNDTKPGSSGSNKGKNNSKGNSSEGKSLYSSYYGNKKTK